MTTQVSPSLLQEKASCEALLKELESNKDKLSAALKDDLNFAVEQIKSRLDTINKALQIQ